MPDTYRKTGVFREERIHIYTPMNKRLLLNKKCVQTALAGAFVTNIYHQLIYILHSIKIIHRYQQGVELFHFDFTESNRLKA